jgi:transcriptional regulator with XRE-family HTH domain
MAHKVLNINITPEWALQQARSEPDIGITSVGGLAHRISELKASSAAARQAVAEIASQPVMSADPKRQSLGKFVELSRRRMRLSVEQFAKRADVDLAELLAIEKAEDVSPEPRTIYQLATILQIAVEPLLELAGLVVQKNYGLTETAVRFAARSEPMDALTKEEEKALNWFVKELTK